MQQLKKPHLLQHLTEVQNSEIPYSWGLGIHFSYLSHTIISQIYQHHHITSETEQQAFSCCSNHQAPVHIFKVGGGGTLHGTTWISLEFRISCLVYKIHQSHWSWKHSLAVTCCRLPPLPLLSQLTSNIMGSKCLVTSQIPTKSPL